MTVASVHARSLRHRLVVQWTAMVQQATHTHSIPVAALRDNCNVRCNGVAV